MDEKKSLKLAKKKNLGSKQVYKKVFTVDDFDDY